MMEVHESRLTNLTGLAAVLRLPRGWLATEADAGRIPCLRVGRRLRFNVEAVRRALAERAAIEFSTGMGKAPAPQDSTER